ncbi:MAG: type II secretion system protein [Desulfobulbaceae bacterium]|nr:type II secretion system protein [Desulfobulbaceae bacterium]
MSNRHISRTNGFSLLELLLTISIIGIITAFSIGISNSLKNMTRLNKTKNRMHEITQAAQTYYQAHEKLPLPTSGTQVPVNSSDLNMEQKFRLDGWGQFLTYNTIGNSAMTFHNGNVSLATDIMTDIRALEVAGRRVAGVIISHGPNQQADYSATGSDPIIYTLDAGSDDIMAPIDVHREAVTIALEELKILQNKAEAFDALYQGVMNDSDAPPQETVDEDGCTPLVFPDCPSRTADLNNDPSCGTATLDEIKSNTYTWCSSSPCGWTLFSYSISPSSQDEPANAFIYCLYKLSNSLIYDPWLNAYEWGDGNIDTAGLDLLTSNQRYHRFFSRGPNGLVNDSDDIIP